MTPPVQKFACRTGIGFELSGGVRFLTATIVSLAASVNAARMARASCASKIGARRPFV
jgi:hypothetical protein